MPPVRLVLDTNVLVSAAIKRQGLQRAVFQLSLSRSVRLYVSQAIIEEYEIVLSRDELGIRRGERLQVLQLVKNHSYPVTSRRRLEVSPDPDDNKFLECAEAANADFLITGNRKHFPPSWGKTKIITSREFLSLIAPQFIP